MHQNCTGFFQSAFLCLLLSFFVSCASEKENTRLFNASRLPSFQLRVDHTKGVVVNTPGGAVIRIRKGTFNEDVELEVKEAYTMKDMLLGGLVTEASGQPLVSGGMIYIQTRDKKEVVPNIPIDVAIPTAYVNGDMFLYKGEENEDGTINWTAPDTLPSIPQTELLAAGKALFEQNCRTCHGININLTGPALSGFTQRGPWQYQQNIYRFIKNPAAFMATDPYTRSLQQQYGAIMTAFPALSPQAVDAVIAYIHNERNNPAADLYRPVYAADTSQVDAFSIADVPASALCVDTLYFDTTHMVNEAIEPTALDSGFFEPTSAIDSNESNLQELQSSPEGFIEALPPGAYRFQVQSLGWYNIDKLAEGQPGTFPAQLSVAVNGAPDAMQLTVYVFFPRYKYLLEGERKADGLFHFEKSGGKLPLFLGAEGFVLAFGSKGEALHAGHARFNAQPTQQIRVNVKPSTEEALLKMVEERKLEGIDLDLKKLDRLIEYHPCRDTTGGDSLK